MKNPFKTQSIVDTLVNVGIGDAANVAMDYAVSLLPADTVASLTGTTKNIIKIALGAIGGSMTRNKYLRAATDGIATVGVSNLVDDLINGETSAEPANGVEFLGKIRRAGQKNFRKVAGPVGGAEFMGK